MPEKKLKCTRCGSVLRINIAFDGCDWNSEKGKGSGYDYEVGLACDKCGSFYPIVRTKNEHDAVCVKESIRPYDK